MLNRTFAPFPVLTTERLTINQLTLNDEQEILTLRSDSEVNKYLGRTASQTIDDARNFIAMITENIEQNNSVYWAIRLTKSNQFVGTICLFDFSDENSKCEIGYELLPNFQNQGLMKEAAEKVIDYAFDKIGTQRIEAYTHADNQSSEKLLNKLSFKKFHELDMTNFKLIGYYLEN